MDFTGIKVLDNIIIDYKYQLEVNERKDKCMNELKKFLKLNIDIMDNSEYRYFGNTGYYHKYILNENNKLEIYRGRQYEFINNNLVIHKDYDHNRDCDINEELELILN